MASSFGLNNLDKNAQWANMASNPYNTLGGYMQMPNQNYQPMIAQQPMAQMQAPQNPSGGSMTGGGVGAIVGGGVQLATGIVDWIKGAKEFKKYKKETESALAGLPEYTISDFAKQELANSQAANNSIDPSILMQYNQLQQGAANTAAMGQRNAMSGSEAINAAALGQQIAASQTPSIAAQQTQFNLANRAALSRALAGMTAEQQNVFNSKNAIANQMLNYKMGLMGAGAAKKASGVNNTVSGASAVGNGVASVMGMGM